MKNEKNVITPTIMNKELQMKCVTKGNFKCEKDEDNTLQVKSTITSDQLQNIKIFPSTQKEIKRKFLDKYTGKSEHPKEAPYKPSENYGCSISRNKKFYAVLESSVYYITEDDNYANFNGFSETTPEFNTLQDLNDYMKRRGIKIGSYLIRTVPINDNIHKPYRRKVKCPITGISYHFRYEIKGSTNVEFMCESEYREIEEKEEVDFGKIEEKINSSFLRSLYSYTKAYGKKEKDEIVINLSELKTILDLLSIKNISDVENDIAYLEMKKEKATSEHIKERYEKMISEIKEKTSK